ncbi:unnamed protein product [Vicia faba]|uniref:Uncharacterized protein n=1 Tax=Vicia faba TaxID=3906 RepID=A0AAV1A7S3_VICFA|nr:unnamed protein product [Vicia faba]
MASSRCTRRLFPISSFKSLLRPTTNHSHLLLNASPSVTPHRLFSPFIRKLGSVQSLLPLHNTVATCRMVSNLSIDSRNCHDVSHVTLSCNHPGP